jgi:16S rRNA (guanine(966)-N(2))-methyltransferase RsmD
MSDAGRVIAGTSKGARLLAPGEGTRPFGDRVKQTLFAILEPDLRGALVLDMFAGSGAGGIEALSRGAARAVFVERDATAARVIAENLTRTRVADRGTVVRTDAIAYLADRASVDGPFDLVLLDPPYAASDLLEAALARLAAPTDAGAAILATDAWVVAKHFWRTSLPQAVGLLASVRTRRFGETALTFYRQPAAEPADVETGRAEEALR